MFYTCLCGRRPSRACVVAVLQVLHVFFCSRTLIARTIRFWAPNITLFLNSPQFCQNQIFWVTEKCFWHSPKRLGLGKPVVNLEFSVIFEALNRIVLAINLAGCCYYCST